MGIKLSIEVTSPLEADDRDLLSGIAVMTLAIANREMAKNAFPEAFSDEDENPQPCGSMDGLGNICVSAVGHRGRHRFRNLDIGVAN